MCGPQDDLDNYSDQLNPNNDAYWDSRGFEGRPEDWEDRIEPQDDDGWEPQWMPEDD